MWGVSWRRGQTATYWSQVLLTIAALLPRSGWAAQLWVTEGRKPSVYKQILTLASCPQLTPTASGTGTRTDSTQNWLNQAVCGTWLYNCFSSTCFQPRPQVKVIFRYLRPDAPVSLFFRLFTQVHLLIDGSVESQYVTIILYLFFKIQHVEFFFTSVSIPLTHKFYKECSKTTIAKKENT